MLDLHALIAAGDVVYFHVDADRYPAASKLLSAALTIDLVSLTGELQGKGLGGLVVIDEFSAFAADQVSRLFDRAQRSWGEHAARHSEPRRPCRPLGRITPTDTLTEQLLSTSAHRRSTVSWTPTLPSAWLAWPEPHRLGR